MFRNFVADINSDSYVPKKKGYKNRRTENLELSVVAHIEYYRQMGLPVYYQSSKPDKLNAGQLSAKNHNIATDSVQDIFKKRKKNRSDWSAFVRRTGCNDWGDRLFLWHGVSIWVLNGFKPPKTEEKITQLEKN